MDEKITVSKSEYEYLLKRDKHLSQLEASGVDNWEWYSVPDEPEKKQDT